MMLVYRKIIRIGILAAVGVVIGGGVLVPHRAGEQQPALTFLANDVPNMADLIVFSYDRPMQLEAYLKSVQKYVAGLRDTLVIYRTSDKGFERGYQVVQKAFPQVKFYQQTTAEIFKPLLLHVLFSVSTCSHFLFGVDDMIMTDYVDLRGCITVMEQEHVYGFYLRLGKNIRRNYTLRKFDDKDYPLPPLREVKPGFFVWRFDQAIVPDWRTCNSVDMTIWRKDTVKDLFFSMAYTTPNSLENAFFKHSDKTLYGACCQRSKVVNLPLNLVQERKKVRCMNFMLPRRMLAGFLKGYRIDIARFFQCNHNATHMEIVPKFIGPSLALAHESKG